MQVNVSSLTRLLVREGIPSGTHNVTLEHLVHLQRHLEKIHEDPIFESDVVFAMFDDDSDGYLEWCEFKELCSLFAGRPLFSRGVRDIWCTITDSSSFISKEEYCRWLSQSRRTVSLRRSHRLPSSMQRSGRSRISIMGVFSRVKSSPVTPNTPITAWNIRHHVSQSTRNPQLHQSCRRYFD